MPADWKQITHGGLVFSIPADWTAIKEREFEGQWGIKDKEKRQAVGFSISRERRPERNIKRAEKEGMTVTSLGVVSVGDLPGEQHQISGQIEGSDTFLQVTIIEGMLSDGDKISFTASLIGMPIDKWQPVIEQVMASVSSTPELVSTLQGYSQHTIFDGLISLKVRNNWEITDHKDSVSWEPPLMRIYGAHTIRFAHGYSLTGTNGMLSKMDKPVVEKAELFGVPAWKIVGTGVGTTYATPMRNKSIAATTTLYLSDVCLAKGDRFGYAITGSEAQLTEHKEALDRLLASVQLNVPEQAGPCDELVTYEWNQGLKVGVPRSWRKDHDSKFQLSWYDKSLTTGADIKASLGHNTTDVHPITGYTHPAETLEQLTIDGYPATHYRKTLAGSDKVEVIYDYYILDTRMRFKAASQQNTPSFFTVQFSTRPAAVAAPDIANHKRVLDSIVFGPEWESETPVVRAKPEVTVSPPRAEQPTAPTAVKTVEAEAKVVTEAVEAPVDDQATATAEADAVAEEVEQDDATATAAEPPADHPTDKAADVTPVDEVELTQETAPVDTAEPVDEPAPAVEDELPAPTEDQPADVIDAPVTTEPEDKETVDQARQRYEQAHALRTEGAALQKQGKLGEAVEKYRGSLSLYPDDRLEAHVRRIEEVLGGGKN